MMEFTAPEGFDSTGLLESLRDDHGYLGPNEYTFYPTVIKDGTTITVDARTSEGNPIDERSRDAIQSIIDNYQAPEPVQMKSIEQLILETNSFAELKQAVQTQRNRPAPPVGA